MHNDADKNKQQKQDKKAAEMEQLHKEVIAQVVKRHAKVLARLADM